MATGRLGTPESQPGNIVLGSPGEVAGGLTRTATDTLATTDAITEQRAFFRTAEDTLVTSDEVARAVGTARTVDDTTAVTDEIASAFGSARTAEDTTSVTDAVDRQVAATRSAEDTTSVSDTVTATTSGAQDVTRTAEDTTSTSDAVSGLVAATRQAEDTTAVTEAVERVIGQQRTAQDATATADAIATALGFTRGATDTLTTSDAVARIVATGLAAGIDADDTTITVTGGTGGQTTPFYATIGGETVLVTAVNGTTWTVQRGVEGTTATSHTAGDAVIIGGAATAVPDTSPPPEFVYPTGGAIASGGNIFDLGSPLTIAPPLARPRPLRMPGVRGISVIQPQQGTVSGLPAGGGVIGMPVGGSCRDEFDRVVPSATTTVTLLGALAQVNRPDGVNHTHWYISTTSTVPGNPAVGTVTWSFEVDFDVRIQWIVRIVSATQVGIRLRSVVAGDVTDDTGELLVATDATSFDVSYVHYGHTNTGGPIGLEVSPAVSALDGTAPRNLAELGAWSPSPQISLSGGTIPGHGEGTDTYWDGDGTSNQPGWGTGPFGTWERVEWEFPDITNDWYIANGEVVDVGVFEMVDGVLVHPWAAAPLFETVELLMRFMPSMNSGVVPGTAQDTYSMEFGVASGTFDSYPDYIGHTAFGRHMWRASGLSSTTGYQLSAALDDRKYGSTTTKNIRPNDGGHWGKWWMMRVIIDATGTRFRAWLESEAEPSIWNSEITLGTGTSVPAEFTGWTSIYLDTDANTFLIDWVEIVRPCSGVANAIRGSGAWPRESTG